MFLGVKLHSPGTFQKLFLPVYNHLHNQVVIISNLMPMCRSRECRKQVDNKLRHWKLGIVEADKTHDVKGTGAMIANHCRVSLHDSTQDVIISAKCHHQCQCFVKCVFVQHHTETRFSQTLTLPSYHFDHLELIKTKQSDKRETRSFFVLIGTEK